MAIQIEKQSRETSQSLARRFLRRVKQSGILRRKRKMRFQQREKSPQLKKRVALRREERKQEFQKKVKMGEIQESNRYFQK